MARAREVYYYDYPGDFGLSGLAGTLCSRTALRLDGPVVLALAGAQADDDDRRLGRDLRLLLDSPLPDEVLRAVWLAAVRRCIDPAEEDTETRVWLRRVSEVCPSLAPERDPYEVKTLDAARPRVPEEELREAVAAQIDSAAPGLARHVAVPGIGPALLRVVREADADLGFRMLLRTLKAYSVPVDEALYARLRSTGERLAYPLAAVQEDLNVRWPPIDPGRRDFALGRFGLPFVAAVFRGTEWEHLGTVRENIRSVIDGDLGCVPGSSAAVLLEDVQRLLGSPLSDEEITALWRTAARRQYVDGGFDAEGRAWLERLALECSERLAEVDPVYTPFLSPARTDLTEAVLREVRAATGVDVAEARGVAQVLEDVVRTVDPDLGFRFLLQLLTAYDLPVTDARRRRYEELAERLGYSRDHVDDRLPHTQA
ncbi:MULTISPECIES: hypothetical protein [unclassified Streptomyces]|uniref:hypothetical protein n=1 Tax=unclassified Streptomyces TaxID=2593676 RepID=UPI0006F7EF2E|nr:MULTISPECIES: hypothetical protein [unclassified Streptomyces]KQX53167.1 hypothetical protein ASD33_08150 [Streptomyces sp. Root1304]KRA90088.1 hypothetical protein ASE09_08155 [Streptomyces sp. Root66D1]